MQDLGLCAALRSYAGEWTEWSGIAVDLECAGLGAARLPVEIETTVYRIVQESLTNVMRHAIGATAVCITIQRLPQTLITIVEDNGAGFDVEAAMSLPPGERRLGLAGMQERALLIGGTFFIESAPGEGTTIVMRLPIVS